MTLAPELPGAMELIRLLLENGVIASLGHSEADYETALAAALELQLLAPLRPLEPMLRWFPLGEQTLTIGVRATPD
jgi:hypothetical protein